MRYKIRQSQKTGEWWVLKREMNMNSRLWWVIHSEHETYSQALSEKRALEGSFGN